MFTCFYFVHWNQGTKTTQEETSTKFKVCCLLAKLIFTKNLGARVARGQCSVRTSIHLSNPNICKLLNILHHNLSIGQLCYLFANSKNTSTEKSQSLKMLWRRVGLTKRCYVIANREHPQSWKIFFFFFGRLVDMCYSHDSHWWVFL